MMPEHREHKKSRPFCGFLATPCAPSLAAHGGTAGQALAEIEEVVVATVEWMTEDGEKVPEPFGTKRFRGNLTLRVPATLHRQLAIHSAEEGVSSNQYILSRIS
jgi:hypothetical protein